MTRRDASKQPGDNVSGRRLKAPVRRRLSVGSLLALGVLAVIVVAAVFPSLLATADPLQQNLPARLKPPLSEGFVLGSDHLGRDVYSRLVYSARPTLTVATISLVLGASIGVLVGLVAGLFGGWIDSVLMRLTDITLSLPMIMFALFLVLVLGPSIMNVVIALTVLGWARYSRVIRGEAMVIRNEDYIAQAQVSGVSRLKLLWRHMLPNVAPALGVLATIQLGWAILAESSLSFLGAGIPAPSPSWGRMAADGRSVLQDAWWVTLFPGCVILLVVCSVNILGDQMRDRMDPMLSQ